MALIFFIIIIILVEAAAAQIVGNDDVSDRVKDKLDVLCVGGACHVAVDLLRGRLVLGLELGLDVGGSLAVLLCSCNNKKTFKARIIGNIECIFTECSYSL